MYLYLSVVCLPHQEDEEDEEEEGGAGPRHPAGVVLKRAGYYTIPPLADLTPDPDGNCIVQGFTIGNI